MTTHTQTLKSKPANFDHPASAHGMRKPILSRAVAQPSAAQAKQTKKRQPKLPFHVLRALLSLAVLLAQLGDCRQLGDHGWGPAAARP